MADVPASLRQADANIYKTAMRAEQLQSVKPIVAYWCMCLSSSYRLLNFPLY